MQGRKPLLAQTLRLGSLQRRAAKIDPPEYCRPFSDSFAGNQAARSGTFGLVCLLTAEIDFLPSISSSKTGFTARSWPLTGLHCAAKLVQHHLRRRMPQ